MIGKQLRYVTDEEFRKVVCPHCNRHGSTIFRQNVYVKDGYLVADTIISCWEHRDFKYFDGEMVTLEMMKAPEQCPWCGNKDLILRVGGMVLCSFICKNCNSYFSIYNTSNRAKKRFDLDD